MRACACNREARSSADRAKNMVTLSFVLSAGIGALAGCVDLADYYVSTTAHQPGIKGFTVAILGDSAHKHGRHSPRGLLLGILESFSIWVMPADTKDVIAIRSFAHSFRAASGLFATPRPRA